MIQVLVTPSRESIYVSPCGPFGRPAIAFSVSFVAVSEQAMHTTRLIDCETVLTFKPLDDGVFITCVGDAQGAGEVQ